MSYDTRAYEICLSCNGIPYPSIHFIIDSILEYLYA